MKTIIALILSVFAVAAWADDQAAIHACQNMVMANTKSLPAVVDRHTLMTDAACIMLDGKPTAAFRYTVHGIPLEALTHDVWVSNKLSTTAAACIHDREHLSQGFQINYMFFDEKDQFLNGYVISLADCENA